MCTDKIKKPAMAFDAERAWVLDFSGGSFLDMPSHEIGGSYTKMLWAKPRLGDCSLGNLISSSVSDQSRVHYMWFDGAHLQAGHSQTGAIVAIVRDADPANADAWTHWAVAYDNAACEMKLYRNGTLVDSAQGAELSWKGGAAHVQIGAYGYANTFEGLVDGVRLFDRALSADEIALHRDESAKKAR